MFESPKQKEMTLEELADKLDELQVMENSGRGVSCVKQVIQMLRMGNLEAAKSIAHNDHDKISNYPEIKTLLKEQLFGGQELYRWTRHTD